MYIKKAHIKDICIFISKSCGHSLKSDLHCTFVPKQKYQKFSTQQEEMARHQSWTKAKHSESAPTSPLLPWRLNSSHFLWCDNLSLRLHQAEGEAAAAKSPFCFRINAQKEKAHFCAHSFYIALALILYILSDRYHFNFFFNVPLCIL